MEHENSATNDTDESSVICGLCGLMFSDELQCNSHMREHMHKCYKCNFESEKVKADAELGQAQYKIG